MTRQKWILAILLIFGIFSVSSTYTRLSETVDEGSHVHSGLQWWAEGNYSIDITNPPLARIVGAAGMYWLNITPPLRCQCPSQNGTMPT